MALINKLNDIGDAIREKTHTTDLLALDAMPAAIRSISGGGEVVFPDFEIKHKNDANVDLMYLNAQDKYTDLINFLVDHGSKVVVKGGKRLDSAFQQSSYCKIEMDGFESDGSYSLIGNTNSSNMFREYKSERLPNIKGYNFVDLWNFFDGANQITTDTLAEFLNNNKFDGYKGALYRCSSCFNNTNRIRRLPDTFIAHFYGNQLGNNQSAFNLNENFENCFVLDELKNLPVPQQTITTNRSSSFLYNASHLKSFTFVPNQSWLCTNQILDLSNCLGYVDPWIDNGLVQYGLPAEKEIKNAETYALYKDDPDAWTRKKEYSRYNHDSAVETINSLPNSTKGTNTIKFLGTAGSLTDGGAINTLTPTEIAVATNKGWTVSII